MGTGGPTHSFSPDDPSTPPATPASGGVDRADAVEALLSHGEEHRTLRETALEALLPRAGRMVAGKYRVEELIARGGMGAVYAATHQVTGKRVAIKWMLPSLDLVPAATERFVREAQATARINHPNVVDIYDVGQEGTSIYLVMEYLHGETLRARMRHGPISCQDSIALLMPALRGVAAAHAQKVVHRDLKPDNIFLCEGSDGEHREAKVLDFGISKFAPDPARDAALTQSGTVLGTPYYMAPEQVRGLKDVDGRADVYAFGVILYELLSGRRPFEADSYNGLILQIATERPVPLHLVSADVPEGLSEVVHRALARSPNDRFQSIQELASALQPFAHGVSFRMSQSLARAFQGMPTPISHGPHVPASVGHSLPGVPGAVQPARLLPRNSLTHARSTGRWLAVSLAILVVAGLAAWVARSSGPHARQATETTSEVPSAPALVRGLPEPGPAAPAAVGVVDPSDSAAQVPATVPASSIRPSEPLGLGPIVPHPVSGSAAPESAASANGRRRSVRPGGRVGASTKDTVNKTDLPAAANPDGLPDDWDIRLRPVAPAAAGSKKPAGSLGEDDFR